MAIFTIVSNIILMTIQKSLFMYQNYVAKKCRDIVRKSQSKISIIFFKQILIVLYNSYVASLHLTVNPVQYKFLVFIHKNCLYVREGSLSIPIKSLINNMSCIFYSLCIWCNLFSMTLSTLVDSCGSPSITTICTLKSICFGITLRNTTLNTHQNIHEVSIIL